MIRNRTCFTQAVVGYTTKNCCQPPDDSLNLLGTSTQNWFFDFAVEKNFWKLSGNLLKTELGCQGRNKHGVDFSKEYLYNSLTQHFGGSQAHSGGTRGLPRNLRWENAPIRPSCGLGARNLNVLTCCCFVTSDGQLLNHSGFLIEKCLGFSLLGWICDWKELCSIRSSDSPFST